MIADHIDFTIIREDFNEYGLENGIHLKVKPIVTDIVTKGKNGGFAVVFDIFSKVISSLDEISTQSRYDETKNIQFRPLKEVVNIYETRTAIILVVYQLDKLFPTAEQNKDSIPKFRIEGNTLVNVIKTPSIDKGVGRKAEERRPMSGWDRDVFRNIFWARLCEKYRNLKRNTAATDFIFDIEGVRRSLQEEGLGIQGFDQTFIEVILREIQDQDGLIELIPDQRRFRLTRSGIEYCRRLPETHT